MSEQIYMVTTEGDCEGRSTKLLGYATGQEPDIREFFQPQSMFKIDLSPIKIVHITPEVSGRRKRLQAEREKITSQLAQIDREIQAAGLPESKA